MHVYTPKPLWSRRRILRDTALSTFLLPLFRRLDASAEAMVAPRRLMLIFTPNGPMERAGPCTGTETNFSFLDWWKPLERHKADGVFLSHLATTGHSVIPGTGFWHGFGSQAFSGHGSIEYDAAGETIDQLIARKLQAAKREAAVASVVWGNFSNNGGTGDPFSKGRKQNIAATTNPSKAFAQLFKDFSGGGPTMPDPKAQREYLRSKRIFERVTKDCTAMKNALGAEGMRLLESHCAGLETMERSLMAPGTVQACTKPTDPGKDDAYWNKGQTMLDEKVEAFWDLSAAALACERTHLIAYQLGRQGDNLTLNQSYGLPSGRAAVGADQSGPYFHTWTHNDPSADRTKALSIFQTFFSNAVASLIDRLKSTKDATGAPLLDSTMVVWMPEMGGNPKCGDPHMNTCLPVAVFGGKGALKTGRYIRGPCKEGSGNGDYDPESKLGGQMSAQILVSAIAHMGFPEEKTVGVTKVNGPLAALYG
jgi:Protein of unknown function (DUF1552)